MPATIYIVLIPLLPLLGFTVLGLFGKNGFKTSSGLLGTLLIGISFLLAVSTAYGYFFVQGRAGDAYVPLEPLKITWLAFSPGLSIDMGILLDPISVMMLLVVTGVSLMVHLFSLSYMKGEERFPIYYAFLGLFTFSMLGLVLSSNIFQIYMFWELVGVSSFLLIGYYYDKPSAVAAAKKAFIVTRFADLGFLIGILVLSWHAQTLDFQTLIHRLTETGSAQLASATSATFLGASALTWGLTLVFMGGAGKSALLPLHIWLPDAMEGPTPVSALIHAATMVTAGIYMIARANILYTLAPVSQNVVAIVGLLTALLAATIALKQNDIKKVLAYSTVSQLGYMFLGLGVGAYTGAVFHVMTHAFFKALLFLGAGSVIHAMHHEQDIRNMGGLKSKLPITHITFLLGCLAIAGIPPFSGFFSKDEILSAALAKSPIYYILGVAGALMTAFYMFRLYAMTFQGRFRGTHEQEHHLHESPSAMTIPLVVLAVLAVFAGLLGVPEVFKTDSHWLKGFLGPVFSESAQRAGEAGELSHGAELGFMFGVVLLILGVIVFAWRRFSGYERSDAVETGLGRMMQDKWYVDELYDAIVNRPLRALSGFLDKVVERSGIDGAVNGVGRAVEYGSRQLRLLQSGQVGSYILIMVVATVLFFIIQLFWKP